MSNDPIDPTLRRPCPLPRGTIRRGGGFCTTCGEVVHDLSTVSRAEARALLGRGDVRCVRFERAAGGRVLRNLAVATVVTALAGCSDYTGPEGVPTPGTLGSLRVVVFDPDGYPLRGAAVFLDGEELQTTSWRGIATFEAVSTDMHRLDVSHPDHGYAFLGDVEGGTTVRMRLEQQKTLLGAI